MIGYRITSLDQADGSRLYRVERYGGGGWGPVRLMDDGQILDSYEPFRTFQAARAMLELLRRCTNSEWRVVPPEGDA